MYPCRIFFKSVFFRFHTACLPGKSRFTSKNGTISSSAGLPTQDSPCLYTVLVEGANNITFKTVTGKFHMGGNKMKCQSAISFIEIYRSHGQPERYVCFESTSFATLHFSLIKSMSYPYAKFKERIQRQQFEPKVSDSLGQNGWGTFICYFRTFKNCTIIF